jgi:putative ABC transport system ATP-binding protein
MNSQSILILENIQKQFQSGDRSLHILKDIDLVLPAKSTSAIIGPSGSGKTTLLGLCAGLDRPTSGRIQLGQHALHHLDEEALALVRRDETGFIFQSFRLIPSLTALENVMVPAELKGAPDARARALDLLAQVGLQERVTHYPAQMSGGEQQRVAIARAFINHPRIIFADEPTGNLDDETGEQVLDLLFGLNRDEGTTLMLVTHDHALTERVQTIVTLKNGRITKNITKP